MGLRIFRKEEKGVKEKRQTKENKEYLFCKSLTAHLMALSTESEWLKKRLAKNKTWNVLLKHQMENLRYSAISSPEVSQTYFN